MLKKSALFLHGGFPYEDDEEEDGDDDEGDDDEGDDDDDDDSTVSSQTTSHPDTWDHGHVQLQLSWQQ